jgi:hypothetical protein
LLPDAQNSLHSALGPRLIDRNSWGFRT